MGGAVAFGAVVGATLAAGVLLLALDLIAAGMRRVLG